MYIACDRILGAWVCNPGRGHQTARARQTFHLIASTKQLMAASKNAGGSIGVAFCAAKMAPLGDAQPLVDIVTPSVRKAKKLIV